MTSESTELAELNTTASSHENSLDNLSEENSLAEAFVAGLKGGVYTTLGTIAPAVVYRTVASNLDNFSRFAEDFSTGAKALIESGDVSGLTQAILTPEGVHMVGGLLALGVLGRGIQSLRRGSEIAAISLR